MRLVKRHRRCSSETEVFSGGIIHAVTKANPVETEADAPMVADYPF